MAKRIGDPAIVATKSRSKQRKFIIDETYGEFRFEKTRQDSRFNYTNQLHFTPQPAVGEFFIPAETKLNLALKFQIQGGGTIAPSLPPTTGNNDQHSLNYQVLKR